MYKSQHLSQFFQKKKLWYNPSNRMYFDSRHCINISPDIFTDIQKKNTHKNPPRNIDSHRQNIDVHTENASNLTDLTNRNKFTQVRRTEVRSVKQDHPTKMCPDVNIFSKPASQLIQQQKMSGLWDRKCHLLTGREHQASGSQGNFRLKSNFQ